VLMVLVLGVVSGLPGSCAGFCGSCPLRLGGAGLVGGGGRMVMGAGRLMESFSSLCNLPSVLLPQIWVGSNLLVVFPLPPPPSLTFLSKYFLSSYITVHFSLFIPQPTSLGDVPSHKAPF
jgi:hypothetical protein